MQVSVEEFVRLVAEKKPDRIFCRTHIGSFDWETWVVSFQDGDTEVQTSFEGSAHATPDVPEAMMDIVRRWI